MKTAAAKVLCFFLGIVISLVLVEAGLSIAGMFFKGSRSLPVQRAADWLTVMCIGDSFVYGAGTSSDQSYPCQLEELLRSQYPGKNICVINAGMDGRNSTQILRQFRKDVDTVRPDLVIFLGGMINDGMNTEGLSDFTREDTIAARVAPYLYRSRAFKLVKYLSYNVREKHDAVLSREAGSLSDVSADPASQQVPEPSISSNPDVNRFCKEGEQSFKTGDYVQGILQLRKAIDADPSFWFPYKALAGMYALKGDHREAIRYYKLCLERSPWDKTQIYWRLGLVYLRLKMYNDAFLCFRDGIEVNREDSRCYCGIRMLSQYPDAAPVHGRIRSYLHDVQKTVKNRDIRAFIAMLERRKNTEVVNRWREHDINEIIDLCEQRNIGIAIMNYPEADLGGLYERIAAYRDIPFVNNKKVFDGVAATNSRKAYIGFDDSHCNAYGYGIMAQNVCDVIVKNKLLDDRRVKR